MFNVNSLLIRTDVTCVTLKNNTVLAGIGGQLHVFKEKNKTSAKIVQVFDGQKIYGIVPNSTSTQYLIYGGCKIKTFACDLQTNEIFQEITSFTCDDWILEAKWVNCNKNIVTVFMHNIIALWTNELTLVQKIICEEKCLLYSAHLVNDTWDNLIVLSGTVFSQVLIWCPKKSSNDKTAAVLHRLDGHKGVIFSIHYNSEAGLICSTSDDRSARLWLVSRRDLATELLQPNIEISLKCSLYGHNARVFRCLVLTNRVLTAGEDSLVNIWNFEGKLIRQIQVHQGACVWGLDCDESNNLIATGGSDCGVTLFPLNENVEQKELNRKHNDIPKKVAMLHNNDIVTISEEGLLECYNKDEDSWTEIDQHNDLRSYALLEVSPCRHFIALAGFHGTIHIYKQFNDTLKRLCSHVVEGKSRIFALHWLSCKNYLTSGLEGVLHLWNLQESRVSCVKSFQLPSSKERWTTAACFWNNKYITVGDRKGNLYLYSIESTDPIQIFKKAHNYLGITNLYFGNNELVSLGRNSVVKKYHFDESLEQLSVKSLDKLPFSWLAAMYETGNTILLLAFCGDEVVLWNYEERRTLLKFPCGGGHRSWDFYQNTTNADFIYIKDRHVNMAQFCWNLLHPLDIIGGYHISEINGSCLLPFIPSIRKCLYISGGEDTTLRISKLDLENNNFVNFTNLTVLKSHLSSIRVVKSCRVGEITQDGKRVEEYLIFSAGGRAQIILWELKVVFETESQLSVACSQKYSYYEQLGTAYSETRIMDLCCLLTNSYVVLVAACSDGTLKVFLIVQNRNDYKMCLIGKLNYKLKCILKVSDLEICNHHLIMASATDGKMLFWNFSRYIDKLNNHECYEDIDPNFLDLEPFYCVKFHQSGINSFQYRIINHNYCIFLSGGDDNAVTVNLFKFILNEGKTLDVQVLSTFCDNSSHCAQITGTFLLNNYFLTASVDQRLNIFKWEILENKQLCCTYLQTYNSAVADIHGMHCFEENDTVCALLYGKGIELCQVQINSRHT